MRVMVAGTGHVLLFFLKGRRATAAARLVAGRQEQTLMSARHPEVTRGTRSAIGWFLQCGLNAIVERVRYPQGLRWQKPSGSVFQFDFALQVFLAADFSVGVPQPQGIFGVPHGR